MDLETRTFIYGMIIFFLGAISFSIALLNAIDCGDWYWYVFMPFDLWLAFIGYIKIQKTII